MHRPSARRRVRFTHVPKLGGVRVLSHLDAALAEAYAAAVARVVPPVERALDPGVVANRVAAVFQAPPAIALREWRRERDLLRREIERFGSRPLLRTDVRACYASIGPAAVEEAVRRCGGGAAAAARCSSIARGLAAEGVEGLPIGPVPSAVLANAVLAAGDAALRRLDLRFVRWVDDWWIEVRGSAHAAEALAALAEELAPAGLLLNEAKTHLERPGETVGRASTTGYHRALHADALPAIAGPDAVVPGDGGMGAGRRPARPARGGR